jgi:hypothetical protein
VRYNQWRDAQQAQLQRLYRHAALPIVELPHLLHAVDRDGLEVLAGQLQAGMEAAEVRDEAAAAIGQRVSA